MSAVLFGLAFPPHSFHYLVWICLVPLFVALRQARWRTLLLAAWLWPTLAAYVIGDWLPPAIATYFEQPSWVGFAFFFFVTTTMAFPYYGFAFWAYGAAEKRFRGALPWIAACAWVACELGRGRLFTGTPFFIGNPWGLIGYTLVDVVPLLQIASLGGIYAVSFCIVAANATIAECLRRKRSLLALALGAVPVAASFGFGYYELAHADPSTDSATSLIVVQANLGAESGWRRENYGENLEAYLKQTHLALENANASLVIWPESAMTFFPADEPQYLQAIASVLKTRETELLAGAPYELRGDFFNSMYLLSSAAEIKARYDKEYLVPFAEYIPFAEFDLIRRRFDRVRVFSSGDPSDPLPTMIGRAGIVTCNESMLPEVVADRVTRGAEFLINPSNDTWIPHKKFAEQQFDIATIRAVEQRRYLVRASTTGPSAIVDPWGRVLKRTQTFTQEVLRGEVRALNTTTFYNRYGDAFAIGCFLCTLAALLMPVRRDASPLPEMRVPPPSIQSRSL